MASNLRQAVLRNNALDQSFTDSDDEWINVATSPGTPAGGASRPESPHGGRTAVVSAKSPRDPLRALPSEVSQKIFSRLPLRDLARCSRVCKRWSRSQTINYVWFQMYRADNYQDDSLPPGKWSKRESKQNWRTTFIQSVSTREADPGFQTYARPYKGSSGYSSAGSGYRTPKEANEERWQAESEAAEKPNKVEMREMYKELGGRKSKAKTKLGRPGGTAARNVGGLGDEEMDGF